MRPRDTVADLRPREARRGSLGHAAVFRMPAQDGVEYELIDTRGAELSLLWRRTAGTVAVIVLAGYADVVSRSGRVRVEPGRRASVPADLEHKIVGRGLFEVHTVAGPAGTDGR